MGKVENVLKTLRKTRAGNSLIRSSLIRSFAHFTQIKWATVSELLRSLRENERPWANRSGRPRQISDGEQFAQVTQRKWANERFAQKMLAKKKLKSCFLVCFIFGFFFNEQIAHSLHSGRSTKMSDVSESLSSLTKNEWFAHIAQRKWAIVSKSLRSLTKNERMSESFVSLSESLIRSFLGKKRVFRSENRWANSQPWGKQMNYGKKFLNSVFC